MDGLLLGFDLQACFFQARLERSDYLLRCPEFRLALLDLVSQGVRCVFLFVQLGFETIDLGSQVQADYSLPAQDSVQLVDAALGLSALVLVSEQGLLALQGSLGEGGLLLSGEARLLLAYQGRLEFCDALVAGS